MAETTVQTAPLSHFGHLRGSRGSYPPSDTHPPLLKPEEGGNTRLVNSPSAG